MNGDGNRDLTRDAAAAAGLPRALVIGYGNPLRSDDGIGWRVAEELRGRVDASRIEVIECRQLTPEMAEQIRTAGLVVFVDAAAEGAPGEWRHHRLRAEDSGTRYLTGRRPPRFSRWPRICTARPPRFIFSPCLEVPFTTEKVSRPKLRKPCRWWWLKLRDYSERPGTAMPPAEMKLSHK